MSVQKLGNLVVVIIKKIKNEVAYIQKKNKIFNYNERLKQL